MQWSRPIRGDHICCRPQCCLMSGRTLLPPRWERPTTSNIPPQSASQGINWKGHGAQAWLGVKTSLSANWELSAPQ